MYRLPRKFLSKRPHISGLWRNFPGNGPEQFAGKIPPQGGCGPAARAPWPGILGNPFCSVYMRTYIY
jgi:hypothetical protein